MRLRRVFFLLLTVFVHQTLTQAQSLPPNAASVSNEQLSRFLQEAERRGLSEGEIELMARANGYSDTDIAIIRERIQRLKTGTTADSTVTPNETIRKQIGEVARRTDLQLNSETEEKELPKVFGKDIFQNRQLNFEPNMRIPTPKNYILGADDELKVDISGYAYQHYDLKISPEGTVKIESLAPIYVNGLTVAEAKTKITERLKTLFGGLRTGGLTVDVTLGDVRSIQVSVLGEVEKPGTYTVSSLARAFHALYLAGGPKDKGSFRSIKVMRDNRELVEIDLYEFLTQGISPNNVLLQDQDILYVPVLSTQVELDGELNRKGLFELKAEETLADALNYAGGFTALAYQDRINLTRNTAKERKLFTLNGREAGLYALQNGDKIQVQAILDRFENKVEVLGAVFRPGEYALDDHLNTLSQLVKAAEGLREDAFGERVLLFRERENLDPEIISVNLNRILKGEAEDLPLKRNDRLLVKSVVELREERTVTIDGAVNMPEVYAFQENMSVKDLIMLAGGFKEGATPKRIEIARRLFNDESSEETVQVFMHEVNKELTGEKLGILKPFDRVFVRDLPNYEAQKLVSIQGEVNYPGLYPIVRREEKIADLVERAGGLRKEAYLEGARFYREGKRVGIDLKKALSNGRDYGNLILANADSLYIPKTQETVTLSGQVLNPSIIAYQPNLTFSDYLAQAGGITDSASVKRIYVRYANGLTDRTRSFMGIKNYPKIQPGMEIVVPESNKRRISSAERIALSSAIVSIVTMVATVVRLLN